MNKTDEKGRLLVICCDKILKDSIFRPHVPQGGHLCGYRGLCKLLEGFPLQYFVTLVLSEHSTL